MPAVRQDLTVAVKLNDQFSGGLREIQRETSNTFDEGKEGSFLSGIKASTVALGALAVAGVAAVGAGLKAAFDQAREFEQAMANVSAITGATGKEFDALSELARDMGATTAHSATAAAEGIQFLGMAGFNTDQIMTALPATLNLASAAGMELGAAADISSNILSGMGMKASDLDGVVDKLAQTSRNANTDVGQLGEAFKMVGPTAAAAGLSFDDTSTSLGLLANAGLQGSIGGTSLNSALRAMINPSKEAASEAAKLGLTFVDTNGQVLPMVNILQQLDDKSVTTKQSFKIFGTEGARAINALRAQGVTAFTALDTKIKESGGVAQDMAETRLGSFDGAMTRLSSAMTEFGISVGETFLPIVTLIVDDFLIPAVTQTNAFIDAFGGLDVMFRDALTFIVGFKNTAINILTELFNNADFAEEFLGNIGSIFTAALGVVMTFAFGSPQMGGLGGMVGIIIELGKIIWEPLKQGFLAIWDFIKLPLVAGINWITENFIGGLNAIITEWNKVGDVIGLEIDAIDFTPLTVEPAKTFKERWTEGTDNVKASWGTVETMAKDIGDNIGADIDNVTAAIADTADTASHLVDEGMKEVVEKWDAATEEMVKDAPIEGKKIGEELTDPVVSAMTTAGVEGSSSMLGAISTSIRDPQSGVGKILSDGLANAISTGDFKGAISGVATGLGTMIGGPIGGAVAGTIAGAILKSGPSAATRATGAFGAILQGFEGAGGDISGTGGFQNALEGIYNSKGEIKNMSALSKLQDRLTDFGMSAEGSMALLMNLMPKLRQGKELPSNLVRLINEELTAGLIAAESEDIEKANRAAEFEEFVTGAAEEMLGATPAAGGYSGIVASPSLFLAGEAGPEMVEITPTSRMSGGFAGAGGANFHFNFSVNTIDEQGVKSFIEEDAKPVIIQMLQRESTRGSSVMYSTGLTTDPSV